MAIAAAAFDVDRVPKPVKLLLSLLPNLVPLTLALNRKQLTIISCVVTGNTERNVRMNCLTEFQGASN